METIQLPNCINCRKGRARTRILVIDDEYLSTFICERFIKKVLYEPEIITCPGAPQALQLLKEINNTDISLLPDYIFLDLTMPMMNGWQFLDEFVRLNLDPLRKCKIYILTASLFMQDMKRWEQYPVVSDYLVKPLDCEKMKKALASQFVAN